MVALSLENQTNPPPPPPPHASILSSTRQYIKTTEQLKLELYVGFTLKRLAANNKQYVISYRLYIPTKAIKLLVCEKVDERSGTN
jgi:hypothetical protein